MIDLKSFSKEWMDSFRRKKEYKSINVAVLEKMIFALSLLEQLKVAGLDSISKGAHH